MKRKIISIEEYQKIHKENESGTSLRELADKYQHSYGTLYYGLQRLGLTIYKATNEQRQRSEIQNNWFETIDSQVKAYYLGLLMSDGYVNHRLDKKKSPRVCLKLHKADSYLVEQLRDLIAPGIGLYNDKNSISCQINSEKLVSDLEKLGLVERKTIHGEHFPDLEAKYMFHFIRGYFDGDGSISLHTKNRSTIYICCANKDFLKTMQGYLQIWNIRSTIHSENRDHLGYRTMYTLHINDRLKFYKKLYFSASIFMIRKKLKYDHVNTVLTEKSTRQRRA